MKLGAHIFILLLFLSTASAEVGTNIQIGPAAHNANEVLANVMGLIEAVLYIAAAVMFTSCILKFRIHFQNPQQIPLAMPLTELVLALVLVALPVITQLATKDIVEKPPSVLQPYLKK